MPTYHDSINDNIRDWALAQQVFFTASAPTTGKHINISPKGLPSSTFEIFDPNHAAYIDATGSGCETMSHIRENGRITIMFCSFATSPRILRFFCTGRVVEWDEPQFGKLLAKMGKERIIGARAVILLDVFKVQISCGYGVPYLSPTAPDSTATAAAPPPPQLKDRETLGHWATKQVNNNVLLDYQAEKNARSLDGLPGLRSALRGRGENLWAADLRSRIRTIGMQQEALAMGAWIGVMVFFAMQTIAAWGFGTAR